MKRAVGTHSPHKRNTANTGSQLPHLKMPTRNFHQKLLNSTNSALPRKTREHLATQILANSSCEKIAQILTSIPELMTEIGVTFCKKIRSEVSSYCLPANHTMLRAETTSELCNFSWKRTSQELLDYMPILMSVLLTASGSSRNQSTHSEHQLTIVAFVVSLLLKEKNQNMSAAQMVLSTLLSLGRADSVTSKRLQNLNITVFATSCHKLIQQIGERDADDVVSWIQHSKGVSIVGDNVDGVKKVRRMRVDRKNVDWHWFNSMAVMKFHHT